MSSSSRAFKLRRVGDGAFYSVPAKGFPGHYKGTGTVFSSRRIAGSYAALARSTAGRGAEVEVVEFALSEVARHAA